MMTRMLEAPFVCWWVILLASLSACGQAGYRARPPAPAANTISSLADLPQDPEPDGAGGRVRPSSRGTPYGQTRARLQFFREDLEFDELDVDVDNGPNGKLRNTERDRFGFRGEFGSRGVGGFFQVFAEQFRAPTLLLEEYDNFGIGGGVVGAPAVGQAGRVEFVVPFKFEVDLVGGSETTGGFDSDLFYLETMFEVGFGARAFGVQGSSGVLVHGLGGLFDADNPASLAGTDTAVISGTNVGVFFDVIYKHERVPLMARARAILGDVSGVLFSFGFAF